MVRSLDSRNGVDPVEAGIEKARRGSDSAFGKVIVRFRPYLRVIAGRELPPDPRARREASDLVQDTFLAAKEGFPGFGGRSEPELRGWLRRILLRKVGRFRSRFRKIHEVSIDPNASSSRPGIEPAATSTSPSGRAGRDEGCKIVSAALNGLPESQRRVVQLRVWEDLTFEEIGRRLGVSTTAAHKAWNRAIKRLGGDLSHLAR